MDRISDEGKGNSDDIATRTFIGLIEEDAGVREKQKKLPSIKLVDVENVRLLGFLLEIIVDSEKTIA